MSSKKKLQDRIDRKNKEIQDLEDKIKESKSYVQGMMEALKFLPDDDEDVHERNKNFSLREGTEVAKARDILREAGRALHVMEILKQLGKEQNKKNRVSLAGSMAGYVRKGQVFTKTAPNTFGLIEMDRKEKSTEAQTSVDLEDLYS